MAKMLFKEPIGRTCGYVCQCGSISHRKTAPLIRQADKKRRRQIEKRSWIRNIDKEY